MKPLLVCLLVIGTISCSQLTLPRSATILPSSVVLPIPNLFQEEGKPPEGWCAEVCIQMTMIYYGKKLSQKFIHDAANSPYPDLRVKDIDSALNSLNIKFTSWNRRNKDLSEFIEWIKFNLAKGYPVLCGIKMYPDQHPDWSVDHFVLIVGYNEDGLLINTNHRDVGQIQIEYSKLSSSDNTYSFENRFHSYFGKAMMGFR